jgi:CheY-like chemotaxis protein
MVPLILIIDDDADYALLLTIYLEQGGYRVATARSGLDGLQAALRLSPVVVTVDYRLPDLNGLEVCQELRASEATGEVPLILVTGNPQPELEEKARAIGVDGFFYKLDLTASAFLATVEQVLRRRFVA